MNINGKKVTVSNPIINKPGCEISSKYLNRIRSHVISRIVEVHKNYLEVLTFHLKVCFCFKILKLVLFLKLTKKISNHKTILFFN